MNTEFKSRFAVNSGCLIDNKSYAFNYGKDYIAKPVISCCVIANNVPILIPMKGY